VADLGTLTASIGLDTRRAEQGALSFRRSMDRVRTQMRTVDESIQRTNRRALNFAQRGLARMKTGMQSVTAAATTMKGAMVGLGVVVGAGMFARTIKGAVDYGDLLQKTAIRTGVTTEALSALSLQSDLAGSSFEELTVGLRRMQKGLTDMVAFNRGEAKDAFGVLGLSMNDAKDALKDTTGFLETIAKRLQEVKDPAAKAALAMNIFGRAGTKLLPLFEQLAQGGMKEFMDEAERLGILITQEEADQMAELNDQLTRMNAVFKGMAHNIAISVTALAEFFGIIDPTKQDQARAALAETEVQLKRIAAEIREIDRLRKLGVSEETLQKRINALKEQSLAIDEKQRKAIEVINGVKSKELGIQADINQKMIEAKKLADAAAAAAKKANDELVKAVDKQIASSRSFFDDIKGDDAGERVNLGGEFIDLGEDPLQELIDEEALEAAEKSAELLKEQTEEATKRAEELQEVWDGIGATIGDTAEDMIGSLIDGTFTWRDALRKVFDMLVDIVKQMTQAAQLQLQESGAGGGSGGGMGIFSSVLGAVVGSISGSGGGAANAIPGASTGMANVGGTDLFGSVIGPIGDFQMAEGGVVMRPTRVLAGEAGAEAIVPLDKLPGLMARRGDSNNNNEKKEGDTNVTFNVQAQDSQSFQRSQSQIMGQLTRAVVRGRRMT